MIDRSSFRIGKEDETTCGDPPTGGSPGSCWGMHRGLPEPATSASQSGTRWFSSGVTPEARTGTGSWSCATCGSGIRNGAWTDGSQERARLGGGRWSQLRRQERLSPGSQKRQALDLRGRSGGPVPVAAGQRRVAWHAAEPRPAGSAKPARRISSSPTDHIRTRSPAGSYMGRNDAFAPYRSPATWISKADDSISSRVTPSSTSM